MKNHFTAFFFIFIANIIILAHIIIPHHHHQLVFCVENDHSQIDNCDHKHDIPGHNHNHDGTNPNSCLLKQSVIVPSSHEKLLKNTDDYPDDNRVFYIQPDLVNLDLHVEPLSVASSPYLSTAFITFVTGSRSLRAPPVV